MHDDAGTHSMQALLDHMTDYNAYDNAAAINIQALSMVPFINPWGMTTEDERGPGGIKALYTHGKHEIG